VEQAAGIKLPLPAGIDRETKPTLWPANLGAWAKKHKAACPAVKATGKKAKKAKKPIKKKTKKKKRVAIEDGSRMLFVRPTAGPGVWDFLKLSRAKCRSM